MSPLQPHFLKVWDKCHAGQDVLLLLEFMLTFSTIKRDGSEKVLFLSNQFVVFDL